MVMNVQGLKSSATGAWESIQLSMPEVSVKNWINISVVLISIAVLGFSAYQEGIQQGYKLAIGSTYALGDLWSFINNYGLAGLIAFCYFTNSKNEREKMRDTIHVAFGVLVSQLAFHAALVYTANELIIRQNSVASTIVQAFNLEWLIVIAFAVAIVVLVYISWFMPVREKQEKPAKAVKK